ncbi:MAG: transglutaminase domain-containing protein [Candidatus Cloacimonetes bacterium]|nr:transglutaminase domain-containing protein [Candidatus Cloacimonadota bacterium]
MNKIVFFIILIISFSSLLFGNIAIDQALIDTLTVKALKNIEPLPKDVQNIYQSYISKYSDGIMAYLISAEGSSILWDANPEDVLSNYIELKKLLEMENYDYSPEFFLSYIAKITASHEQITPYRKVFTEAGLLSYVTEFPDIEERIREVNLWCRERMTFISTSGRNQNPITIQQKSNIGRCGEMQVFFISACRTIGIPARPAWTPWWGHMDNNHAWTEVFVDAKWYYVGAAEPDYNLNSTWFSSAVNKALLVLARSTFPDSTEEVVSKSHRNNYINSTSFYQDTRKVKFTVVDSAGNPVPKAVINIMAFNFSMLRTLLGIKTDSTGTKEITIGKGGFLAIARKDSLFDYKIIPFYDDTISNEFQFILEERKLESEDLIFQFPDVKTEREKEPEFFKERKKMIVEKYNERIKNFQSTSIPGYAPEADSNFVEIFKKCRNNKQPLLDFVVINPDISEKFWEKVGSVDVKFFWEASVTQWQNLFDFYMELEDKELSDIKWKNLIEPSVFYEVLPDISVPAHLTKWKDIAASEAIPQIIEELHALHKIEEDSASVGLISLDKMLEAEFLQDYNFKTLSCYILKANHIPAQYTRIPSTIMVMADSVWQNYDVKENNFVKHTRVKPQEEEVESLAFIEFKLVDKDFLPVTLNPDNISTTIFQDGRFYHNDRQLDYDKENSILSGELEKGDYYVQLGIRESSETTKVKLIALHIDKQVEIKETLIFKDFKRDWKKAGKKYTAFLDSLRTEENIDYVILLGDYDDEPVQRLATKTRSNLGEQKFVWIGKNEPPEIVSNYITSDKYEKFMEDNPELKHRLITFYYDVENEKWMMFEGNWDLLCE